MRGWKREGEGDLACLPGSRLLGEARVLAAFSRGSGCWFLSWRLTPLKHRFCGDSSYIHACAQSKHVVHTNKRGKYECMHLVNLGEVCMGILCNLCNCEIISK